MCAVNRLLEYAILGAGTQVVQVHAGACPYLSVNSRGMARLMCRVDVLRPRVDMRIVVTAPGHAAPPECRVEDYVGCFSQPGSGGKPETFHVYALIERASVDDLITHFLQ